MMELAVRQGAPATAPPEDRGLPRDGVRLLVARPGRLAHSRFRQLGDHLRPGDVLVVNTSSTRPSAVDGRWRGRPVVVHFSTELEARSWSVELRLPDGSGPMLDAAAGDVVLLDGGRLRLETPLGTGTRIWSASVEVDEPVRRYLERRARPITYGYSARTWPLERYQTVFARPGDPSGASAESPSAGRPFTTSLVTALVSMGVAVMPIALHAGVSSLEAGELPLPEWYDVPPATAAAVTLARRRGSRVVAVGTTVTRALESASDAGATHPSSGWTDLVLSPTRPARAVTGLVTGWHPPEASHLLLLEAVAGAELVAAAYKEAVDHGYLWHEFGDSALFLP